MSLWKVKTTGQLERLNHLLIITDKDDGLEINHKLYGHVCNIFPDDEEAIQLVRDILTELSADYNKGV